ncbi:ABC transporter substrate-binding protein [Eubacteriales bacterium OttesenSCG-928-K08]|nr:ABC transporter substrate-binding protein [Eubacteriales bacterium OttesenSCG-928-K08]
MKKLFSIMLAIALMLSLVACSAPAADPTPPADPTAPAVVDPATPTEPEAPVVTDWATENRIDDGSQTVEELYELAKEEGALAVYSISSRMGKVAESFMAQYPGIVVETYDISSNELREKVTREYEAGIRNADVIHLKDTDGGVYIEMVQSGMLHSYRPDDIVATIENKDALKYGMPLYIELNQWFYNAEAYPDGPPFTSWWELTKPEWKGKIIMQNVLDNINYMASFTAAFADADAWAADYEKVFGEPIVLSEGSETAVHEFFKRFLANEPIFESSSDAVTEAVGTPGQTNPPVGYAASSKLRKNESEGWVLAPINVTPDTGIPGYNNLYLLNECAHPNAAKLFVRWICGEADGTSPGFDPFNTLGGWPIRSNVTPAEGSTPLSELNVNDFDPQYIYDHLLDFNDFWLTIQ